MTFPAASTFVAFQGNEDRSFARCRHGRGLSSEVSGLGSGPRVEREGKESFLNDIVDISMPLPLN
jgi:hypothetical protein